MNAQVTARSVPEQQAQEESGRIEDVAIESADERHAARTSTDSQSGRWPLRIMAVPKLAHGVAADVLVGYAGRRGIRRGDWGIRGGMRRANRLRVPRSRRREGSNLHPYRRRPSPPPARCRASLPVSQVPLPRASASGCGSGRGAGGEGHGRRGMSRIGVRNGTWRARRVSRSGCSVGAVLRSCRPISGGSAIRRE